MPDVIWENLTPEEKKAELYRKQKELLDMFLERNAISKAQYDKSLGDLTSILLYYCIVYRWCSWRKLDSNKV